MSTNAWAIRDGEANRANWLKLLAALLVALVVAVTVLVLASQAGSGSGTGTGEGTSRRPPAPVIRVGGDGPYRNHPLP